MNEDALIKPISEDAIIKTCTKCKREKPLIEFYSDDRATDKLMSACRDCHMKLTNTYAQTEKGKVVGQRARNKRRKTKGTRQDQLKYRYGITQDDYNQKFNEQKGCCAICGKHQSEFKRRLCVDHNHKTGNVRGLLCINCNRNLSVLENKQFIEKSKIYLGQNDG